MDVFIGIERDANVVAGEKMLALCTEAHFTERPPAFEWVGGLKHSQFSADGFGECVHTGIYLFGASLSNRRTEKNGLGGGLLRGPAAVHGEH